MRFGGAGGILFDSFEETDEATGMTRSVSESRAAASLQALFGGTPAPGVVVGGGFLSASPLEGSRSGLFDAGFGFGPFVSWYPDPETGMSVLLMPAIGELSDSSAFLIAVGAALEGWVGEQWSLGADLRYVHLRPLSDASADPTVSSHLAHALLLGFIATLH
jgi:hypothetical protein